MTPESPSHAPTPEDARAPSEEWAGIRRPTPRRARRGTGIKWLRRLLLVALLASVGGLGALFVIGRSSQPGVAGNEELSSERPMSEQPPLRSEQFESILEQDGQEVFRIRGAQTSSGDDGTVLLSEVEVEYPRDGNRYLLYGDEADYNQVTNDARLEGDARVVGPESIVLEADWLDLRRNGMVLIASDGTTFRSAERLEGQSEKFRIDFEKDLFTLSGGVRMWSVEGAETPFTLSADHVYYEKEKELIRAQGGVVLNYGDSRLSALRLSLYLDEATGDVRYLRALWNVDAELHDLEPISEGNPSIASTTDSDIADPADPADEAGQTETGVGEAVIAEASSTEGGVDRDDPQDAVEPEPVILRRSTGRVVNVQGMSLALLLDDEGDPANLEIEGLRVDPAVLTTTAPQQPSQTLKAAHFTAQFREGVIAGVASRGKVHMARAATETEPALNAEGETSEAAFDGEGTLQRLVLHDAVVIEDGTTRALGDRAELTGGGARSHLFGEPVEILSDRGTLLAPEVVRTRGRGLIHAKNGVRSTLASEDGGSALPIGAGEGPVRVESEEAFLNENSREFTFKGNVRAWQGTSFIVADQLRGEESSSDLRASGNVRTVWVPDDEVEEPETANDEGPSEEEGPQGPIEVSAAILSYSESDQTLHYERRVVMKQAELQLACQDMTVHLDSEGEADEMICLENVTLTDGLRKRVVKGTRAHYRIADDILEMEGAPLLIRDPQQGNVKGQEGVLLVYRISQGSMSLQRPKSPASEPAAPAATTGDR